MDVTEIQPLYDTFHRKIAKVDLRFKRYFCEPVAGDMRR